MWQVFGDDRARVQVKLTEEELRVSCRLSRAAAERTLE
jgi:hypothetical protein